VLRNARAQLRPKVVSTRCSIWGRAAPAPSLTRCGSWPTMVTSIALESTDPSRQGLECAAKFCTLACFSPRDTIRSQKARMRLHLESLPAMQNFAAHSKGLEPFTRHPPHATMVPFPYGDVKRIGLFRKRSAGLATLVPPTRPIWEERRLETMVTNRSKLPGHNFGAIVGLTGGVSRRTLLRTAGLSAASLAAAGLLAACGAGSAPAAAGSASISSTTIAQTASQSAATATASSAATSQTVPVTSAAVAPAAQPGGVSLGDRLEQR